MHEPVGAHDASGVHPGSASSTPVGMNPGATVIRGQSKRTHHEEHGIFEWGPCTPTCGPNKPPLPEAPRRLPLPPEDRDLRHLVPIKHVRAEHPPPQRLAVVIRQREHKRHPGIVVPHLGGVDAVPDRVARSAVERVVDGRAGGAVQAGNDEGVLEGLDVVALLLVRDEAQPVDDLLRRALVDRDRRAGARLWGCCCCWGWRAEDGIGRACERQK